MIKAWSQEFPHADIFTLYNNKNITKELFPNKKINSSFIQKYYNITKSYKWLLSKMPQAIESIDLSKYEIILSSSAAFSHGILTNTDQLHISYIHSPMRWAWDYHFKFQKEHEIKGLKKLLFLKIIHKIRIWDYISSSRPNNIIAPSREIQKRIKKYWNQDSEIIAPFYDENIFFKNDNIKKDNYFIVVSQLIPYKKIEIIINSFNETKEKLKIVGSGSEMNKLKKISKSNIEFTGRVLDKDLAILLNKAKCFIVISIDDFGMSPVEALACGTPVIAYNKGGSLDWLKDNINGVFINQQTKKALIHGIDKFNKIKLSTNDITNSVKKFTKTNHINKLKNIINTYEHKQ